ncbi:MAG: phage holin family protein [Acidobacteriota bacterium]|nr:phage holin family protein [Acidobacteriota bacterium]
MSSSERRGPGGREGQQQAQSIAGAVTEISERAMALVHEEIELAKAEVSEKVASLLRGTVVALAAGVFLVVAVVMALFGLALFAWWILPVGELEIFWGFFAVAAALVGMAALAGYAAWRAVRAGTPPVPSMAMEEARKIRESVSASPGAEGMAGQPYGASAHGEPAEPVGASRSIPGWDPLPTEPQDATDAEAGAPAGAGDADAETNAR